jgi:hypothetical protein
VDPDIENIFDDAYVRALAHPLRMRIERTSSPARLAALLGARVNVVAHHVRRLHELGLAELVDVRPGRGGLEHFYAVRRRPTFTDEAWERLKPDVRAPLLAAMLRQIGAYVGPLGGRRRLRAAGDAHEPHAGPRRRRRLESARERSAGLAAGRRRDRARGPRVDELFDADVVVLLFEAKPFSDGQARLRANG